MVFDGKLEINENLDVYLEKEVHCPVCGRKSSHVHLKDEALSIDEKQDDSFISRFRWTDPFLEHFHPYYFHFWHCIFCGFTGERNVFLSSKSADTNEDTSVINIYQQSAASNEIIKLLASYIRYPYPDYPSTLSLHLLAIYVQLLPDEKQINFEKVARYYHRLSWIFRLEGDQKSDAEKTGFDDFMSKYENLQSSITNSISDAGEMKKWLEKEASIKLHHKNAALQNEKENLQDLFLNISKNLNDVLSGLHEYYQIGLKLKKQASNYRGENIGSPFHEFSSYGEYLLQIKGIWPEMPVNEDGAIQKAIESYLKIIESNFFEEKKLKTFRLYRMVGYLYGQLNDFEKELLYLNKLLSKAIAYRDFLISRLRHLEIIKDDRINAGAIKSYVNKTNSIIRDTTERKKAALDKIVVRDNEKAKNIYYDNQGKKRDELAKILREANIMEEIIEKFLEANYDKKRLGILKFIKLNLSTI